MKHHPSATPSFQKKKRVVSLLGGPTRKSDDDDDDDEKDDEGNEELLRSIFGFITLQTTTTIKDDAFFEKSRSK